MKLHQGDLDCCSVRCVQCHPSLKHASRATHRNLSSPKQWARSMTHAGHSTSPAKNWGCTKNLISVIEAWQQPKIVCAHTSRVDSASASSAMTFSSMRSNAVTALLVFRPCDTSNTSAGKAVSCRAQALGSRDSASTRLWHSGYSQMVR